MTTTKIIRATRPREYLFKEILEHSMPNTSKRLNIRAIVQNGASLQINALIRILPKAKNSNSFLDIRVLILDEKSHADVRPQLEIETNDVKASHAASVGPIDPEQLFYLESRGLNKNQAVYLIVDGFLKHA